MKTNKSQAKANNLDNISVKRLEREWKQSPTRFTDKELLSIFLEAKQTIPEKIKEWEQIRIKVIDAIKKKLTLIKHRTTDEFSQWFWKEWVKINEGQELLGADNHIMRLKRLLSVAKGRVSRGWLTEEQIQRALAVSIENLTNQPLRKCGRSFVGLCPFHNEKHPSFHIYPETNSFYCFGCQKGGNVITLVGMLYGYSFKEAVKHLIGEK